MGLTQIVIKILTNSEAFVSRWGYLGIFIVSFISSSSVLFPLPGFIVIFTFGAVFNPLLVAFFGALGATAGSITSYFLGLGGKEILENKYGKKLNKIKKGFTKYKGPLWIVALNASPLPEDLVSIFCGIIRYDFKKFILATFIGQMILTSILAYSGFYSVNWILDYFKLKVFF
jgi:membrane protein YqaA with SNARE-associated domain